MYIRDVFAEKNPEKLRQCMQANPLAMLVVNGDPYPQVFHLPLLVSGSGEQMQLRGHIARANPLSQLHGVSMLAVFNGPDAYISPAYYASKQLDPKVVPTWNYVTVQVQGRLILHEESEWKLALLSELTQQHEQHRREPWQLTDAPSDYIEKMSRAIVGVEIDIEHIQGKWKVSQNQPEQNKQSVARNLAEQGTEKASSMSSLI